MNDTIYYIKINQSENVAIEDKALRVFIKMKKTQDNGQLVFGNCTDDVDKFYIIQNEVAINQVIEEFKNTGVQMEYKNITSLILNGSYYKTFIEIFNTDKNSNKLLLFMKHNLTIDALYDKIIKDGEDCLASFEKIYLSSIANEKP